MSSTEATNALSFADLGLSDSLLKTLTDIGYETPSPIQAECIPILLQGRDLIGQAQTGTGKTAALLDIILQDEIGHVGLGDSWFRHLCEEQQLEPESTFRRLLKEFDAPCPLAPMNETARLAAGFTKRELAGLLKIE